MAQKFLSGILSTAQVNITRTGNAQSTTLVLEDNARIMKLGRDAIDVYDVAVGNAASNLYLQGNGGNAAFGGNLTTTGAGTFGNKLTINKSSTHVSGNFSAANAHLDLYNSLEADTDQKGSIITFTDNYPGGGAYNKTTRAGIKGGTDTTGNTANGYLEFYTDSGAANSPTLALRLDSSQNATFAGNITTSGNIILAGASNEIIKSDGSIRLNIDSNNDQTNRVFIVSTGANSELFKVEENGNGTFTGAIGASNLSGTNTGDQDLSGYLTTSFSDYVSKANGGTFDEGIAIKDDTNTGTTSGKSLLTLWNVNSDISQQQTFIDFKFTDTNANHTPQVRIGAQVGPDADANAISKEGAGSFVVYTAPIGNDELGGSAGLAERFRVGYNGTSKFTGILHATQHFVTPLIYSGGGSVTFGNDVDLTRSSTGQIISRVWNSDTSGTGTSVVRIANSGGQANGARLEFSDQNYYNATVSVDRTNGMRFMVHDDSTNMADLLTHTALTLATDKSATFTGSVTSTSGTSQFSVVNTSAYQLNGTYIVDSSRNLVNISQLRFGGSDALIDTASVTSATATTDVASVVHATYTAAFFDFVIKNGTNVRAGVVYACHDGTTVSFTETSTVDLGDTSDVTLSVVIDSSNMVLRATSTSSTWTIKSLIRAI